MHIKTHIHITDNADQKPNPIKPNGAETQKQHARIHLYIYIFADRTAAHTFAVENRSLIDRHIQLEFTPTRPRARRDFGVSSIYAQRSGEKHKFK